MDVKIEAQRYNKSVNLIFKTQFNLLNFLVFGTDFNQKY